MFVVDRTGIKIMEYTLGTAYDVSTATYSGDSERLAVTAASTENPEDLAFNNQGTKLFVLENTDADSILEYSCTTGFDVSTCSHASSDFALTDSTNADAFEFSSDGTLLYVADPNGDDRILQYYLSTAWDVSTASLADTFDISAQESAARGLAFGNSGTKLYVTGTSDTVWQYDLDR